jgi:hypothetical protein
MSPLYLLTHLPSLFPTDLYFDPPINVSSPIYESCKVSKIEYWYMKLNINSEDVGSYFAKAWFSIEDAGNAKL